MVLYELLCIARADLPVNGVKEIARSCGQLVLRGGGVVRTYEDWGTMILPKRIRKHQTTNVHGRYWLMHFDTNPAVVGELRRTMSLDPRIVRANLFKLGDRLDQIVSLPSDARWHSERVLRAAKEKS